MNVTASPVTDISVDCFFDSFARLTTTKTPKLRTTVPLWFPVESPHKGPVHYDDVIMTMLASQITSLTVVYSIVYSGVNQRKHQSSASLAFVREIHRGPVNFPHKWPVTRKIFPFDDVIMCTESVSVSWRYGDTGGFVSDFSAILHPTCHANPNPWDNP